MKIIKLDKKDLRKNPKNLWDSEAFLDPFELTRRDLMVKELDYRQADVVVYFKADTFERTGYVLKNRYGVDNQTTFAESRFDDFLEGLKGEYIPEQVSENSEKIRKIIRDLKNKVKKFTLFTLKK